jgi:hypothetical protein
MAQPRFIACTHPRGALSTWFLATILLTAASLTSSCTSTRACKTNTLLVTVSLDGTAAMADKLSIAVTVGSGAPTMSTLTHTAGQASGTVEIDFPNGYPKGQKVNVGVTATKASAPIGSGSADSVLGDGCETVSVSVTGASGGTGGNGGSGMGGVGAGGMGTGGMGMGGTDAGAGGAKADAGVGGSAGSDAGIDAMSIDTNKPDIGVDAGCLAPANTMCGGCFVTTTDRAHCGATCAICGAAQVCSNSLCVNAVAPAFATTPADPTGWLDPSGAALMITVVGTSYTGAIYECRTGPDASFTTTTPAWAACDGGAGTGLRHVPTPTPTTVTPSNPGGNYRTEFRYRSDTYTSPAIATRYYVHHGLDKVGLCPRAGVPADGPHFADADYFAAATTYGTANPSLFPLSATFPVGSAIPARTDTIYLRNPFIKIPFIGVSVTFGMASGMTVGPTTFWPIAGGNYGFNERSLRHVWVLNPARTMILLKRRYVHPSGDCREQFVVGQDKKGSPYLPHRIDCEAMVLNSHGNGICFNGPGSTPVPVALDAPPNGAGTVTGTLNSATVAGNGTAFSTSLVGQFIQIPAVTGRWYKVVTVATATSMTISPVYANTTSSGNAYRITLTPTYIMPAAYAKMHPDAHNYATGATSPGTPSPKTKCERVGCDTNMPWLTYLPP